VLQTVTVLTMVGLVAVRSTCPTVVLLVEAMAPSRE
jgi:hypothetical protein